MSFNHKHSLGLVNTSQRPVLDDSHIRRTLRDDHRMNYYDRLQLNMQRERTRINSAPIIKKRDLKGSINHEPPMITTKKLNFHTYSLNHSVVPINSKI